MKLVLLFSSNTSFRKAEDLCGLVSTYIALESTLLTKHQLKIFNLDSMKDFIKKSGVEDPSDNTKELLEQYFDCNFFFISCMIYYIFHRELQWQEIRILSF